MKKLIKFLMFLLILDFNLNAQEYDHGQHGQHVHQYLCREAWNLLSSTNPGLYNNIDMKNWIGNDNTLAPWSFANQERVVAGVWDEDEEDVIWHYTCWFTSTNTHFWKANSPGSPNQFTPFRLEQAGCLGAGCDVGHNAWDRMQNYVDGGWEIFQTYNGQNLTFQRYDNQAYQTLINVAELSFCNR